jgi:hypothetical protein
VTGSRAVARSRRRGFVALLTVALAAGGCAAFRAEPLDVPPGHRVVLGEISISGFGETHVTLDIAREDGTFRHELPIDAALSPFVITLPPGWYQITRLRLNESGRIMREEMVFPLRIEFQVGDAAVYVGTLQIDRITFGRQLGVQIRDEYDRTIPALRARRPDLPSVVVRGLARPF